MPRRPWVSPISGDPDRAETIEKSHGRIEHRFLERRPIPSRLDTLWPGATFIVRIERRRELRDRCQRQVIYAITSLPTERADAATLLDLSRRHWAVENELFHVRDRTLKEDECRVRSGTAPAALATIRDATLNIIRARKQKPRPAREAFAANPKSAIRASITA